MKCQILFSGKNKKNISKCRLLKILPRVLSVKQTHEEKMSLCHAINENPDQHVQSCSRFKATAVRVDKGRKTKKKKKKKKKQQQKKKKRCIPKIMATNIEDSDQLIKQHGCAGWSRLSLLANDMWPFLFFMFRLVETVNWVLKITNIRTARANRLRTL